MGRFDITRGQQQQAPSVGYMVSRKPTEASKIGGTKKVYQLVISGRIRNGCPRKVESQALCIEKIKIGHAATLTKLDQEPNKTERSR